MSLLGRFDTPGNLRDAPVGSGFYDQWHKFVSDQISKTTMGDNGGAFYNASLVDINVAGDKVLTWMGFPRDLMVEHRDDPHGAYLEAENDANRPRQNEYFEWRVERNSSGKISKLTFVTETGDYYEELWKFDPNLVLGLYRSLVSPLVQLSDLSINQGYNRFNRWNTADGIVHYIQAINTLPDALRLSQDAVMAPNPHRDNYEATPGLATAKTSVDPRVSYDIYMLIRKGLYVTLRDPIGLYIVGWNNSGLAHPDGSPAGDYWRIVRGQPGMVLRLEYEVPPALGFVVGDMTIGGRAIEFGGQFAEQITVGIGGSAGTSSNPARPTRGVRVS